MPCGIIPFRAPTPLIVSHRTVKLRGFASGQLVMVRRIKLSSSMVLVNQIASEPKHGRKFTQIVYVTHGFPYRTAVVKIPAPASITAIGNDANRHKTELLS